ncbi:thiol-disulfide isomerase/thioredoxin [Halopolyspora algeriensis]|uniref:Thiol-disulfide isomerase/thioredoxin n=1 Tax=Halopolyspora algeriensis TaxID=1500506 RepID=A0A368VGL4_9ACTN|nr:TlpA disulfide reductase family protein [Halopolyspora algeriensis]RCW40231.1 thiol-disulfide isomerase/thioredoxin [Halopolyspora algeriensis]TQM46288.1 thiol-disulfide isomerase/thioredoxin [Halopolyspora algeriensis]
MNRFVAFAGEFRNEIRWTIVVVVLAVLAAVALWPRDAQRDTAEAGTPPASAPERQVAGPERLAELRARADLAACPTGGDRPAPAQLAGATGTCLADGSTVDVGKATAGRATLINVWATWCPPCRKELPVLQEYSQQPGSVRVLGLQVKSEQADGLELLDRLGVTFPSVHDRNRRISAALQVPSALPASYVVTPSGRVHRLNPEVFESPDEVRAAVQRVLGGAR